MNTRPPVGHTCPDINQCLTWLKEARQWIDSAKQKITEIETEDSVHHIMHDLEEAIKYMNVDDLLEELRESNSALREWGYELVDYISKLENET